MESAFLIRPVTRHDSHKLAILSASTFFDTFAEHNTKEDMDKYLSEKCSPSQMESEILESGNQFFFALENDIPIGYLKLRTTKTPEKLEGKNILEIERIYVSTSHLSKKVGAQLMQFCVDYAKEKDYEIIWLAVWEHNIKATNFYERWGFEKFGSQIFVLGDDKQTDFLMKKKII